MVKLAPLVAEAESIVSRINPPLDPRDISKILIVRPNHRLGNNVLLTPLLTVIERFFPNAEVDLLCGGGSPRQIFSGFRQVRKTLCLPNWSLTRPDIVLSIFRDLRGTQYDLVIDPSVKSRSGRWVLGICRARYRLGYAWKSPSHNRHLTHVIDQPQSATHMGLQPVILLSRAVAESADRQPSTSIQAELDLRLSDAERAAANTLVNSTLDAHRPAAATDKSVVVALYTLATGSKNYPETFWREVAEGLRRRSEHITILEIIPGDGQARLAGVAPGIFSTGALRELSGLIAESDLFITGDCGVMHLGRAGGARVLGLFKTTDPSVYGPYGGGSESLMVEDSRADAVIDQAWRLLQTR